MLEIEALSCPLFMSLPATTALMRTSCLIKQEFHLDIYSLSREASMSRFASHYLSVSVCFTLRFFHLIHKLLNANKQIERKENKKTERKNNL